MKKHYWISAFPYDGDENPVDDARDICECKYLAEARKIFRYFVNTAEADPKEFFRYGDPSIAYWVIQLVKCGESGGSEIYGLEIVDEATIIYGERVIL